MRKVIKIFVGLVFSVVVAAVFVPLTLSVPAVQNAVGQRVMARLSQKIGTTLAFDRIELRRLNHIRVEGLYVADLRGDTLLYIERVEAPIEQLPMLGRDMVFGRVELEGARMWIDRDSLGAVNIRQLVRRIPGGAGGAGVYINGITARGIDFALTRHDRVLRASGVDFSRFVIHDTDVDISRLAVEGSDLTIDISSLGFVERTGWRMDRLSGKLLVGRWVVALTGVEIDSEGSRLRVPRIAIKGHSWRSFGRFADSVSLAVEVVDSRLTSGLLGYFLSSGFEDTVEGLTASVEGPLGALKGRIESARTGGTELELEFASKGLPRVAETVVEGTVTRFTSTDAGRFYAPLKNIGKVEFAGDFAGSLAAGFEVAGRVGVAEARLGELGAASGELDVRALLGGPEPTVKAAGTVSGLSWRGRRTGPVEVSGEWRGAHQRSDGGEFEVTAEAVDPLADWGVRGALKATANGSPDDFGVTAELRNALYTRPRGAIATPKIELTARVTPTATNATLKSELLDATARLVGGRGGGELAGEATLKASDELLALFAPGLRVEKGARLKVRADIESGRGGLRLGAGALQLGAKTIHYRGAQLTDARLEARRDERLTATLTAKDLYAGALHIPRPRLEAEIADRRARLTLDGANYLTVSGLASDSLHIDLAGFDLAALGGLTPKGTRVDGYVDIKNRRRVEARVGARNMDAALLAPLLGSALTDARGLVTMDVRAAGELDRLRIDGAVELTDLSARVASTGARYSVDSARVEIANSHATLPPTAIRDRFGGTGDIAMEVEMANPADVRVALNVVSRGLLAFDRQAAGGFGGRVFASGTAEIFADRMGTVLKIDAQTDRGTTIRLPLSGHDSARQADFIAFAAPPGDILSVPRSSAPRGGSHRRTTAMSLEMTARVTDDAELHLTIDPRLGRGITARGDGVISLAIDPQSKAVSVTGDYTIRQGRVELSMMDVLNRNFTIAPASAIRLNGAPADATLDVKASYRVRTSLAPLLGETAGVFSDRANVPVDCVLTIAGRLDEPRVGFDVELPSVDTDQRMIAAEQMNTDELRSMQFLSLLVTGNFTAAGSIGAGTGASTEALTSGSMGFDILTSQLGNLLSSEGYDVHFRYRPEDNFLTNRFDMGFAAGFARDRLRLEIEGNYVDDRAAVSLGTQRGMGNLAGDVSLTWVIDAAGNLRLKVFSQTIDRLNETQGLQESGLGVYWRKDFDRLRDIFGK